jgi:hypothetical protein
MRQCQTAGPSGKCGVTSPLHLLGPSSPIVCIVVVEWGGGCFDSLASFGRQQRPRRNGIDRRAPSLTVRASAGWTWHQHSAPCAGVGDTCWFPPHVRCLTTGTALSRSVLHSLRARSRSTMNRRNCRNVPVRGGTGFSHARQRCAASSIPRVSTTHGAEPCRGHGPACDKRVTPHSWGNPS